MQWVGRSTALLRESRAIGTWLLIVFVLGQAYAGLHHAIERHTVCAKHGEIAHGDPGHDHSVDAESESHGSEVPVLQRGDEDGEHGDHCSIPTCHEQRRDSHGAFGGRVSLVSLARGVEPSPGVVHRSIALIRLAPKQSPPRFV